jgi:ubiquinone/menaquinone biosynthesis C-methylase UbiE
MNMRFDTPVFVLTSDVDWAPDVCIDDLTREALARGVRPVFFATGPSEALDQRLASHDVEVGWHPNFRPGSTQGLTETEVVQYLQSAFPTARCWRAHGFADSSVISQALRDAGMVYDSNLNLHLQDDIQPLQHTSGLVRFPVFWEDDVHWLRGDAWDIELILEKCLTPGLKIFNVHPAAFALNIPDSAFYQRVREGIPTLSAADIENTRFSGAGTRTFILALLDRLLRLGHKFHTLGDVYAMVQGGTPDPAGRGATIANEEYQRYQQAGASERQAQLRALYNQRDHADPYATSRDVNLRELEIAAFARYLPAGRVLDLGCGNGYTLLALGSNRPDCEMVGVDFAERLIEGAHLLADRMRPAASVRFVHADAIEYVRSLPAASVDAVLTERFLLNLPDVASQRAVIGDIFRVLAPGGRLLMCEGSMEGFRGLNEVRVRAGLDAVEETSADNASAIRFEDAEMETYCRSLGFALVDKVGFRDYFLMSRVLHPLLVAPQPPRFTARINALARHIQTHVPLAPGVGSNIVWVYGKVSG